MNVNSVTAKVEESRADSNYSVHHGVFGVLILLGGTLLLSSWLRRWRRQQLPDKIEEQHFEPDELDEDSFDIYGVKHNELYPPSAEISTPRPENVFALLERLGKFVQRLMRFVFGSERETPTLPLPPPRN
ncbi:hypothetical protein [Haladaptatus sp. NG-SE-30]